MNASLGRLTVLLALVTLPLQLAGAEREMPALIPWPGSITMGQGAFALPRTARIIALEEPLLPLAEQFASELAAVSGLTLDVREGWARATPCTLPEAGDIVLGLDAEVKAGGYRLTVKDRAEVQGGDYRGAAAGTVTLLQSVSLGEPVAVPRMSVRDEPQAEYCGIMFNLCKREIPLQQIRDCLPLCRFYKIRYLHLRLTDDDAWTFPSTAYPQLGAPRPGAAKRGGAPVRYAPDDLRQTVALADRLGVTLVPEISMPGHSALIRRELPQVFGPDLGMMDPTREAIYPVLDTLLKEAAEVFASSPYLHIGGDEADFTEWVKRPEATNYVEKTGLNPPEILGRFFERMNATVTNLGKRAIVWEAFEKNERCPVPAQVVVMSWHGRSYRPEDLIRDGYSIINCPRDFQSGWQKFNLYEVHGSTLPTNAPVLGASWNLWELPPALTPLDLLRHAGRLSERVWLAGTNRPPEDYSRRLAQADKVADRMLFRLRFQLIGPFVTGGTSFRGPTRLEFLPYAAGDTVRYTVDGSDPTSESPAYTDFIELTQTTILKARTYDEDGQPTGLVWLRKFTLEKP